MIVALALIGGGAAAYMKLKSKGHGGQVDHADHAGRGESQGHEEQGEGEKLQDLKARASKVGPGVIERFVKAPGVIDFHPKHALRIHPAYSGLVQRVHKKLGDPVQAGEVLATIESNVGIQTISVTSPIKGVVLARYIGEGQSVTPEEELFSVGNAAVLQARLAVAARDAKSVQAGMDVLLVTEDSRPIRAKVAFMTPILSEETRTATALIDFASPRALPGMFVTGAVVVGKAEIERTLPAEFCSGDVLQRRLRVLNGEEWEPREVTFGLRDYERCEVLAGLDGGAEVLPATVMIAQAAAEEEHQDD